MEEEERLKSIFANFDPDLTSDNRFLSRLQRNIESVELVKRHAETQRRRNRRAIIAAAVTGVIFGIIVAVIFPVLPISLLASSIDTSLSGEAISYINTLIIAAFCLLGTLLTYAAFDIAQNIRVRE